MALPTKMKTCGDSNNDVVGTPDDIEVKRMAHRISSSAWAQLAKKSGTMSENVLLREYILMCPYVPVNSPAIQAALEGLKKCSNGNINDSMAPLPGKVSVPSLSGEAPPQLSEDADLSDDTSVQNQSKKTIARKKTAQPRKRGIVTRVLSLLGYLIRMIFLDFPLLTVFISYATTLWVHHVHDEYLAPQLVALNFNVERRYEEHTYYNRPCDAMDLTTKNGADIFLSRNATSAEAYEHHLKHGFSVFKSVLTQETSDSLRTHVMSRKHNLTEAESIFVIENKNRFSFGLGTEEPSVTKAIMEIGNHPQLRPAMEKIMGPNPALIEMTAITASYGAKDQYWHDDVVPHASAINFGRTFGPSYSIFIVLQNTSAEMGATAACPGTHYCSEGPIPQVCQKHHFQVAGDHGAWETGDALLMNMNSYHRGAAHTDPNGLDRVMMILTFVPRPLARAETRQMSQGITFSLRWDMWGHCLDDLAKADTAMKQPWATLRALGLYKSKDADWGVDYISGSSMRMANSDNGFNMEALETHVRLGGIPWLPNWLEAEVQNGDTWHSYLYKTLLNVERFLAVATPVASAIYFSIFFIMSVSLNTIDFGRISRSMRRLALLMGLASLSFWIAKNHVDNTDWAHDIKAQLRYTSTTESEINFWDASLTFSTMPTRYDILVETRYGAKELAMYNDFINGHPANRHLRSLIGNVAATYPKYDSTFANATREYLYGEIVHRRGRFLQQAPNGGWYVMGKEDALSYVDRELRVASSPLLQALSQTWRFTLSKYKYGIYRNSYLVSKHTRDNMYAWDRKLFKGPKAVNTSTDVRTYEPDLPMPFFNDHENKVDDNDSMESNKPFMVKSMLKPTKRANTARRAPRPLVTSPVGKEPFEGAWIQEGDLIEGYMSEKWWPGVVGAVSAHGQYLCNFADGDQTTVDTSTIRRFVEYKPGEVVEAFYDGMRPNQIRIMSLKDDGRFTAWDLKKQEYLPDVGYEHLRRLDKNPRTKQQYKGAY